jgi:hypothetical protein
VRHILPNKLQFKKLGKIVPGGMDMGKCSGNCGSCSGCAGVLELTQGEVEMLTALGQFAFLPVARKQDDMVPVYLEDRAYSVETYSLILQCLEQKKLISIDYDKPMGNVDMSAYGGYPVHGSFALTQRGQSVVDMLERQGIR